MGCIWRDLRHCNLVDLSLPISPSTAEPEPPHIEYIDHRRAATELARIATRLIRQTSSSASSTAVVTEEAFTDRLGLANETLTLDSHAGTHMDAPWHFGPRCEGKVAKTIDEIPLEWCFGPGVKLDLRKKAPGEEISVEDLQLAAAAIPNGIQPGDIVLIQTGADRRFHENDYFSAHPGMGRAATLWLLDRGVRVIGIDGWGFDRPAGAMLQDYLVSGDRAALLPAHLLGREREYCHIEKLGRLDLLPSFGFWVCCFPVKIERGSAGWVRAVALVATDHAA